MKIGRFEDLECWKEARKLVNMVYKAINSNTKFKNDLRLKNQCIGAVLSIMGNIPEGFVRRSNKEFIQFLFISISSGAELQSHFYVALDQNYVTHDIFDAVYNQTNKVGKMVSNLISYLFECNRRFQKTKKTKKTKKTRL